MKLIKVTITTGNKVIINRDNISYFFGTNETETMITLTTPDEFFTVSIPIEEFIQRLEACDDSRMMWEFN